ncbi:MAG: hypothetical protein CMF25_04170 [Kangiellaceae bacterium]|nr:hypothetical protein [Kangiellaceae bacterium]
MWLKIILVIALLLIVFSLFQALFYLVKGEEKLEQMNSSLGRRVFFSVAVIMLLLLAIAMGWIKPNKDPFTHPVKPPQQQISEPDKPQAEN